MSSIMQLPISTARVPEAASEHHAPQLRRLPAAASAPRRETQALTFGADGSTLAWWVLRLPLDYGGEPRVALRWMSAATGAEDRCTWAARIDPLPVPLDEWGQPTEPVEPGEPELANAVRAVGAVDAQELRGIVATSVAVPEPAAEPEPEPTPEPTPEPEPGPFVPDARVLLLVARDADDAADTLPADAELVSVALEYATA